MGSAEFIIGPAEAGPVGSTHSTAIGRLAACKIRMRENAKFPSPFKLIWAVQILQQKYSASNRPQITGTSQLIPCPQEGRIAIVTDVGRGERWTRAARADERRGFRTEKASGPDAPALASNCAEFFCTENGGKKARSPGRAQRKP